MAENSLPHVPETECWSATHTNLVERFARSLMLHADRGSLCRRIFFSLEFDFFCMLYTLSDRDTHNRAKDRARDKF